MWPLRPQSSDDRARNDCDPIGTASGVVARSTGFRYAPCVRPVQDTHSSLTSEGCQYVMACPQTTALISGFDLVSGPDMLNSSISAVGQFLTHAPQQKNARSNDYS